MVLNDPALWRSKIPVPAREGHKYDRGHLVVVGGGRLTGAARLAAEAAMRMGAGLCTIAAPEEVRIVYQQESAPHLMVEAFSPHFLDDPRRNAVLAGPGADAETLPGIVAAVMAARRACVLDAGAVTCFTDRFKEGAEYNGKFIDFDCVLTPHQGEFARAFPGLAGAAEAAALTGAAVLLKGADTVIAAPDGRAVTNSHASPYLATAGSGDVLAGMIAGLVAQGVAGFDAACISAWVHGEAALRHGPGLVAPDLIAGIPAVLAELCAESS
jgi:NAD(P)H-hydrate epimerase